MGPRIIANKKQPGKDSEGYQYYFEYKGRPKDAVTVDKALSNLQIKVIDIENTRRMMTERISESIYQTQGGKTSNAVFKDSILLFLNPSFNERPPDDKEVVDCPRYQEIKDYLIKHRTILALDTMDVDMRMPDHVMLNHIIRNDGLDIEYDEWTSFLITAHRAKDLFSYVLPHYPTYHVKDTEVSKVTIHSLPDIFALFPPGGHKSRRP